MEIKEPVISIIIPAYQASAFLERAIESVLRQSFTGWEIIIINDGSTDSTPELSNSWAQKDRRISVIHQANKGLSGARNRGISRARGNYIQFLDADDELLSTKLAMQLQLLEEMPHIDIIFGNGTYAESGKTTASLYPPPRPNHFRLSLLIRNFIVVNSPLIRSRLLDEGLQFKEVSSSRYPIYGCEDWEFWLRAAFLNHTFYFSTEISICNHLHDSNMSARQEEMIRSYLWLYYECKQLKPHMNFAEKMVLETQILHRRFQYLDCLLKRESFDAALTELECATLEAHAKFKPLYRRAAAKIRQYSEDSKKGLPELRNTLSGVTARIVGNLHRLFISKPPRHPENGEYNAN